MALIFLFSYSHSATAQESATLVESEQQAFQQAVAAAAPCVVQIETFGGLDQVEQKATTEGPLTGTIVGEDGWIIASLYGLREQPASILVNLPDGTRASAKIVSRDFSRELALLKVETTAPLPVATESAPASWQVGQWAIAIGKTYDAKTVTQSYGILSAIGRAHGRAVQTDAKVSPINYGGPLIDLYGKIIGILTPIAASEMLGEDSTVLYDSGIGFAVPLVDIQKRLATMQAGKDIHAGKLGIVTKDTNEMAGPVVLSGAAPGSPAARAGMKSGDVIVSAGGQPIELFADLRHALAQLDAGDTLECEIQRGEQNLSLSCELVAEIPVYRKRFLGIQIETIEGGLEVQSVIPGSPAAAAGIEAGHILTRSGDVELKDKSDLLQILSVADLEVPLQFSHRTAVDILTEKSVSVRAATWPEKLIDFDPPVLKSSKPANSDNSDKSTQNEKPQNETSSNVEMRELKLTDVPNKIHAIIPTLPNDARQQSLGCLIVFGEPGELSPDKLKANWAKLAQDYGWLVVFPASANPQAWSRDEIELVQRLLARLEQEYSIDPSRIVVGGLGIGGQLALFAAMIEREKIRGVFTLGTELRQFPARQASSPMQTLDFLLIGNPQLEKVTQQLGRLGHVANSISVPEMDPNKWDSVPLPALVRWLELLRYL